MAKIIPASTIKHVQNAPGLTASQRASLKQSPAEKKARMASAQGRMGSLVSNFAKRQRGEKTPTGVGRPGSQGKVFAFGRAPAAGAAAKATAAGTQGRMGKIVSGVAKGLRTPGAAVKATKGRMGNIVSGVAKRLPGRSAAEAISSLSRPQKRKSTRNNSRSSGRR